MRPFKKLSGSSAATSRITPEGITGIKTQEPDEDHAWVARIEAPDDLYIRQGRYNGPSVLVYFPPIVRCFQ